MIVLREYRGQVKTKTFSGINASNMQQFIDQNVDRGRVLRADEARFYRPVKGYQKWVVNHSMSKFVNGMTPTNNIESVWADLKRGYHGTLHQL